jgi:hypothetical protein
MGRYFLHDGLLFHEMRTKESHLHTEESEWASVLSRLEDLEPSEQIKAVFERFVRGELTIQELQHLSLKRRSSRPSEDEQP